MRTYRELVQRLHQECDLNGSISTVVGLTAGTQARRLADWIADAWVHILEDHLDYKFRRRSLPGFTTTEGQGLYSQAECGIAAGSAGYWHLNSFTAYLTASGFGSEIHLEPMSYDEWRKCYNFGANRTAYGSPRFIAEDPQTKGLVLGPIPLGGYTILGDYQLAPTADRLTADSDTPGLPEKYDSLGIVWRAMLDDGAFEASTTEYQRASQGWSAFKNMLERGELPTPDFDFGL